MAARANFSARHLARLFDEHLQMTPAQYVERVRVEAARAMLESTDDGLPVVAQLRGLRSPETMRRAFLRELGVSPGAYRSTFRTTGIVAASDDDTAGNRWRGAHRVPVSPPPSAS